MAEPKTEQPGAPITLSVNCIHEGRFIRAGDPTPYEREEDLPLAMRPFVATGNETPFNPAERDIYSMTPLARRQARRLEMDAAHQEFAEAVASEPLREDVAAALEASHDLHIGKALAQARYNQAAVDAAYQAAQPAESPQRYVRRGGAWGHVERAKLKPGEHVFVKRENGEMEAVGVVDSRGGLPPEEITP